MVFLLSGRFTFVCILHLIDQNMDEVLAFSISIILCSFPFHVCEKKNQEPQLWIDRSKISQHTKLGRA